MSTQTQRDNTGQCNGLWPNHCHCRHYWKENNWKENRAKRGILFCGGICISALGDTPARTKTGNVAIFGERGWRPQWGRSAGRLAPHGTCTTIHLQQTGTCQQPRKHFHHNFSSQPSLKEAGGAVYVYVYRELLQERGAKKEKAWSPGLKMQQAVTMVWHHRQAKVSSRWMRGDRKYKKWPQPAKNKKQKNKKTKNSLHLMQEEQKNQGKVANGR